MRCEHDPPIYIPKQPPFTNLFLIVNMNTNFIKKHSSIFLILSLKTLIAIVFEKLQNLKYIIIIVS